MEFGPLWDMLATWQNGLIIFGCGAAMEIFKRGPLTSRFAETTAGKIGAYYAPIVWAWIFLFLPVGLHAEGAGIGPRFLLGVVLGMFTSEIYTKIRGTFKNIIAARQPEELVAGGK